MKRIPGLFFVLFFFFCFVFLFLLRSTFNVILFNRTIDENGLPLLWELRYFGQTGLDPNSSPTGNGLTLLQDYQQGNDPWKYYSQNGGTITPVMTIAGGNHQEESPNTFLPQPLSVAVEDSNGKPLANAPVLFDVLAPSDGKLASSTDEIGAIASLCATTDRTGTAQIYYSGASAAGSHSSIRATANTAIVIFAETTSENKGDLAAATGINVTPGTRSGQMILHWINHATNAKYIIVQQSLDNVNWVTIAQINDPTVTTYTVNEADPTKSYYFGVIAGKP